MTDPLAGLNPTLVTSVVVAFVGAAALVIVAKLRKPVSIQDLWLENRGLREEQRLTDLRVEQLEKRLRTIYILAAGFDALSEYVEVLHQAWGAPKPPALTATQSTAINAARQVRSDQLAGPEPEEEGTP